MMNETEASRASQACRTGPDDEPEPPRFPSPRTRPGAAGMLAGCLLGLGLCYSLGLDPMFGFLMTWVAVLNLISAK